MKLFATLILALLSAGLALRPSQAEEVTLFAAASLTDALQDVLQGSDVRTSYASSSTLAKQIVAGASPDIFISANDAWVLELSAKHLIAGPPQIFARNTLILLAPPDTPLTSAAPEAILRDPRIHRIALGEPNAVPLGIYAKAALESLGLWQQLQTRTLIYGQSATTVINWVARGEVDLAVTYGTDAARVPGAHVLATLPETSHPPVIYWLVILNDRPQTQALQKRLLSEATRSKLTARGFAP